jgi:hypothetical protein
MNRRRDRELQRGSNRRVAEATRALEAAAQRGRPDGIRVTVDRGEIQRAAAMMGVSEARVLGFVATTGVTPGTIMSEWQRRIAAAQTAEEQAAPPVPTEAGEKLIHEAIEAAEILADLLGPEGAAQALAVGEGQAVDPLDDRTTTSTDTFVARPSVASLGFVEADAVEVVEDRRAEGDL